MSRTRFSRLLETLRRPPVPLKAAIFLVAVVAYSTAGFMFFEGEEKPELQWLDALWWSVVTMTTVGFGDYFPSTDAGRLLVGLPTMLVGMGMLGYVLSQFAVFLMRGEALNRKGLVVQKLSGHILLCNDPGRQRLLRVIGELRTQPDLARVPVVLVDEQLDELDAEVASHEVRFVRGHPAREQTLERAGVRDAYRAVVLARDARQVASDDLTVATCLTLHHLRPDLHVVAECVEPENKEVLARAGCRSIVCVTDLAPGILVQEMGDPGLVHVLHELTLWREDLDNIFIVPLALADGRARVEGLRRWSAANDATLLGLRCDGRVLLNPPAEREVRDGDAAIVICRSRPAKIEV